MVSVSSVQSLSHVRLCDPLDCSTAGLPVHHQLPEFTQTHVHWVGDRGDMGSIPGSGRSPGGRHGNPLQSSYLEKPMGRRAWWATDLRVAEMWLKWLSTYAQFFFVIFFSPRLFLHFGFCPLCLSLSGILCSCHSLLSSQEPLMNDVRALSGWWGWGQQGLLKEQIEQIQRDFRRI